MSHARTRTVVSLLTVLLFSLHWADDVVRGFAPGGLSAVWGLLIVLVWLYATLVLAERRAGLVLIFLGSILGSGVPILHVSPTRAVSSSGCGRFSRSASAPCCP